MTYLKTKKLCSTMMHWESQKAHPRTLLGAGIRPTEGQAKPQVQTFVPVSAPWGVHAVRKQRAM